MVVGFLHPFLHAAMYSTLIYYIVLFQIYKMSFKHAKLRSSLKYENNTMLKTCIEKLLMVLSKMIYSIKRVLNIHS